ncbi:terpene synthase family protein [Phytohabitans sp. ZYX-F-186]|uniref:Terpene synthase family protein n=1 Tax=Phytohabitans maris TaxID=3071409 RepID=A0ABU0ZEU4_9ACTN|nr:terpene synthase family protein [Phytohabitans sp. ZYX-F-186]MDQ7905580.1 terpene synthase family protein [Phytohabitans sp. ZYX-F-186]
MGKLTVDAAGALSAVDSGRVSAVAGQAQRDLQAYAARYPALFPSNPFDPALYSTVALANAFCGPWFSADELRVANRATLWAFALDWQIDYLARSHAQVAEIVRRCLAVVDGTPAEEDDLLGQLLADILSTISAAPAYPALRPAWRLEFQRMVEAMAREWEWQASREAGDTAALPTFEDYLDNADNICFSFVFLSHWVSTSGPPPVARAGEVLAAGRKVQEVIRLLNDLGTYDRDVTWGDLNPMMLGVTRDGVTERIGVLVAEALALLRPLHAEQPELAAFLERYIGFNKGFYGLTDYWGDL